jgi:Zn finger protein HypA/HybF involved in hydrogenase expression
MKFGFLLMGIFSIFIGILLFFGIDTYAGKSGMVKATSLNSQYHIIGGILFLYISYHVKEKKQKYTICPKCKESFNYNDLENGKCPYCEDVDTIDIEEYYKENKINEDKDEK